MQFDPTPFEGHAMGHTKLLSDLNAMLGELVPDHAMFAMAAFAIKPGLCGTAELRCCMTLTLGEDAMLPTVAPTFSLIVAKLLAMRAEQLVESVKIQVGPEEFLARAEAAKMYLSRYTEKPKEANDG